MPDAKARAAELFDAWARNPDDESTLRVIADFWSEQNDPRGEFVQLCLTKDRTPTQQRRLETLKKKGGALVGPARPFIREWRFAPTGVVDVVRCEADLLAEGIDEISALNPRLVLNVTSLKKQSTIQALAKVSLERVHYVTFTMNIIGSLGGSNVTDKALVGAAPAFRRVRNLALQARGAGSCFSPAGLRAFADHLEGLEFLGIDFAGFPSVDAYVDVITTHSAFKSLKAIVMTGADADRLRTLPNVVAVHTEHALEFIPSDAHDLARLKSGAPKPPPPLSTTTLARVAKQTPFNARLAEGLSLLSNDD